MKKAYVMVWVLVLLLAMPVVQPEAGTFYAGVKFWYETTWDSAMLDIFDQAFADRLERWEDYDLYNITSDTYIGSGYLAGPVLGYQTSGNVLSISLAPMVFSSFSQKMESSSLVDYLVYDPYLGDYIWLPMSVISEVSVDVTRTDFDLAVSYALLQFRERVPILEYCKLFLGFKYQEVDYDFKYRIHFAGQSEPGHDEFDYEVYMPTVGIGFVYPFTDDIAVGIQAGIGMAFFTLETVDDGFAYNFEANVNITPIDNMIVQFGYRYQAFVFDLTMADTGEKYESTDKTYGPTVTLVYTF